MNIIAHGKPELFKYDGIFHQTLWTGPESKECSLWLDTFSPGAETPRHYCVTEQVVTILSGTGKATVNGRTYELAPDTTIVVPAHVVRSYQAVTPLRLLAYFPDPEPRILDPDGKEIELPWQLTAASK
jgi:quercetin dioxygenase-like cupin family protein